LAQSHSGSGRSIIEKSNRQIKRQSHLLDLSPGRARGDHRPDSDIDLRIFVDELELDPQTMAWWMRQNQTECAELKSQLPPYALHVHTHPEVFDAHIKAARASPKLKIGKVACVCIPPKP
jgi:hypothetical protein